MVKVIFFILVLAASAFGQSARLPIKFVPPSDIDSVRLQINEERGQTLVSSTKYTARPIIDTVSLWKTRAYRFQWTIWFTSDNALAVKYKTFEERVPADPFYDDIENLPKKRYFYNLTNTARVDSVKYYDTVGTILATRIFYSTANKPDSVAVVKP